MNASSAASAGDRPDPPPRPLRPRALSSDDLFRGERELVIVHQDQEYRLRITRAGKLILTK